MANRNDAHDARARKSQWRRRPALAVGGSTDAGPAAKPARGNAGNGSTDSLRIFFFFGEGCGNPLLLLPAPPSAMFSCIGDSETGQVNAFDHGFCTGRVRW